MPLLYYTHTYTYTYTHTHTHTHAHTFSHQAEPKNVMLVHGEAAKMEFLRQKVMQEFGVNCFMPPNGETVTIKTTPTIPVDMSRMLFKRTIEQSYCKQLVHQ